MDNPFTQLITEKATSDYYFETDTDIGYQFANIGFDNKNIISGQADQFPIIIFMIFLNVFAVLFLWILCLKGKRGLAKFVKGFAKSMKWNFYIWFGIELMLMGFINVNLHIFYHWVFNNYKDICSYILALLILIYLAIIYALSFFLLIAF